jgi:SAM-dependent methyltransferase
MAVNWIDTSKLSFNSLLLLERIQISWFPGWLPEKELAIALGANPVVEWFLRNKCPEIKEWIDKVVSLEIWKCNENDIYQAEQTILNSINDLLTYVIDPSLYEAQPFLRWNSSELTSIVDFTNKVVLDVGSGTGKLAFIAAPKAKVVYAVEPVSNLRFYLKRKARKERLNNVFAVDGMITDIPFPDNFTDISMGGYVFGDNKEAECLEMERVTKKGGMVIYCPGNNDEDNEIHQFLVNRKYKWSKFEELEERMKRKYWKCINGCF